MCCIGSNSHNFRNGHLSFWRTESATGYRALFPATSMASCAQRYADLSPTRRARFTARQRSSSSARWDANCYFTEVGPCIAVSNTGRSRGWGERGFPVADLWVRVGHWDPSPLTTPFLARPHEQDKPAPPPQEASPHQPRSQNSPHPPHPEFCSRKRPPSLAAVTPVGVIARPGGKA